MASSPCVAVCLPTDTPCSAPRVLPSHPVTRATQPLDLTCNPSHILTSLSTFNRKAFALLAGLTWRFSWKKKRKRVFQLRLQVCGCVEIQPHGTVPVGDVTKEMHLFVQVCRMAWVRRCTVASPVDDNLLLQRQLYLHFNFFFLGHQLKFIILFLVSKKKYRVSALALLRERSSDCNESSQTVSY